MEKDTMKEYFELRAKVDAAQKDFTDCAMGIVTAIQERHKKSMQISEEDKRSAVIVVTCFIVADLLALFVLGCYKLGGVL